MLRALAEQLFLAGARRATYQGRVSEVLHVGVVESRDLGLKPASGPGVVELFLVEVLFVQLQCSVAHDRVVGGRLWQSFLTGHIETPSLGGRPYHPSRARLCVRRGNVLISQHDKATFSVGPGT